MSQLFHAACHRWAAALNSYSELMGSQVGLNVLSCCKDERARKKPAQWLVADQRTYSVAAFFQCCRSS